MPIIKKGKTDKIISRGGNRPLWPRYAASFLIRFYQKTLSFDHGFLSIFYPYGFCRFQPTCSQYAREAILKYGCLRGGIKAASRLLRCHPFSPGGYDPLK